MFKRLAALTLIFVASLFFVPLKVFSATDHVVINEVQIAGNLSSDDFIELYNPTDSDYDLTGHRLVKRTASGSSDSSIKAFENGTVIAAHSYYLWSNSSWDPGVAPDSSTSATIAANNGIALRNGPVDTGTIIDSVAWGSVEPGHAFIEGSPYPDNPESLSSIERNGDDTDNNSVDFVVNQVPSPQNSTVTESPTPTASASPSASPTPTQSPSPSPTTTPEPTASPEPTTTPEPSPSPTVEPTQSPTPEPSLTPTPTPMPRTVFLGAFTLGHKQKVCFLTYKHFKFGFANVVFPKIKCVRI